MSNGILLPYQAAWVEDDSRFKIWLASRQIGKSFALTLEAVLDAVERRTTWVFLSAGERQALELAEKAKLHLEAIKILAEEFDDPFFDEDGERYRQLLLHLPNGSRLIFLPANPSTARGYTANVALDEFAFHKDSAAIWAALFPSITRSRELKLRICSTPFGKSNMFYRLWDRSGDIWARHRTDIHQAISDGLPIDATELEEGLNDPVAWQQEYLLEFLEEATAYLSYELIAGVEDAKATVDLRIDEIDRSLGPLYLGMDVGRKRDLSVIWILQRVGDVNWTRMVIELERMKFAHQKQRLWQLLPLVDRACIDATGLGMQLAEEASEEFWQAEPVTFTNQVKSDLATTLRRAVEDRTVRIPVDDRIREDLHSVRRVITAAGNIRFDAEADANGHADRFWGLALAQHASVSQPYVPYESFRLAKRL